jgi:DNA invertase Pin-like site-specific DNA recombinase
VNGLKKIWKVAIYARVSTDKKEQQETIPAQVSSLRKWLLEKSKEDKEAVYNLIEVYEDQGFSGSNFERDSFIRMKEDIEKGKINMILTRDLSRFARNYVVAGYYLEDYFKENGVRFVSVLDNVDTIERSQ